LTAIGPRTILWLIGVDHESGMRHGGNLRWFNLSRELLARGCTVYFAVNRAPDSDLPARIQYLDELKRDGFISGYFALAYQYPRGRARLALPLAYHPAALKPLLRRSREEPTRAVEDLVSQNQVEVLIISDRAFLFLVDALRGRLPILIDWVDSFVLYFRRAVAMQLKQGAVGAALSALRNLPPYYFQERYYARRSTANLVASPVDKECLDAITGRPEKNHALLNGLSINPPAPPLDKIETRLIFTGNMNFPPNYEAAVWFIDEVLPRIRRRRPEITLTVAGRNPMPALLARAGPAVQILGDVADIPSEIGRSALYVAPLISGGGFKNKVIESISCGTYVVSTSRGVEFLDRTLRDLLLVADTPEAFAERVLRFLSDPGPFNARLGTLMDRIAVEYTWRRRAEELLAYLPRTISSDSV
jgi:glycosyltransferase involved in cell wall biosynthesis